MPERARPMIGTNTKMSLRPLELRPYFEQLRDGTAEVRGIDIFVLPPFVALALAAECLAGSTISWGAQDVFPVDSGAYTGQVSAPMLVDLGCRYAMVGHYERRRYLGETDELVAEKAVAAQRSGITPLIAVGETDHLSIDESFEAVRGQLEALVDVDLADSVIAYEPGWAIGIGAEAADDEWITGMHARIRSFLSDRVTHPALVQIITGGSVTPEAAQRLIDLPNVDGLFVGRHARDPRQFANLIRSITTGSINASTHNSV